MFSFKLTHICVRLKRGLNKFLGCLMFISLLKLVTTYLMGVKGALFEIDTKVC